MSYDIYIGGESFNYTFNVSRLFCDHIPDSGKGGGLRELDGVTGKRGAEIIGKAFSRLGDTYRKDWKSDTVGAPAFCARYDAKNGWGSTVGAILFLADTMAACVANPRKRVRVSL